MVLLSPFRMGCVVTSFYQRLANYVCFYALFNLPNLLYIRVCGQFLGLSKQTIRENACTPQDSYFRVIL